MRIIWTLLIAKRGKLPLSGNKPPGNYRGLLGSPFFKEKGFFIIPEF